MNQKLIYIWRSIYKFRFNIKQTPLAVEELLNMFIAKS